MLEAIKKIKRSSNIKFKCLIAGTGPEENNIKKFIKKNNLENIIFLLGKIEPQNISLYYKLADIFVFSSKSETQGMVLLEAMAGFCPVVAIKSSGIDDIVINNKNGFKTEDNLNDWSDRVIYLMENKDLLKKMSEEAHEFSKKYSIEIIAKEISSLYKKILSKK
jgi:glycosyltransferase involved in cell wall biosynthesis